MPSKRARPLGVTMTKLSSGKSRRSNVKLRKTKNAFVTVTRATPDAIHRYLRNQIITGKIGSDATLSQVSLARDLGVSRTPVREAMRMLQNEGLIDAQPNNSARVRPYSADDVDAVYAMRILLEPLAVALSIPRMTNGHLQALEASFGRMNEAQKGDDFEKWIIEHRLFHCMLAEFSGKAMLRQIERLLEQSTRFHYMLDKLASGWLTKREADHAALLQACKNRRPNDAYQLMLDHLAETALTLLDESAFPEGRPPGPAIEGAISIAAAAAREMKATGSRTATTPLHLLLPIGVKKRGG